MAFPQDSAAPTDANILHASAVSIDGAVVLITGGAGSGKSSLALALMSLGAALIADDRVQLTRVGNQIMADSPDSIRGKIEARFVGILNAKAIGPLPLALVVDLEIWETARIPPQRSKIVLGESLPLLHNSRTPQLAAAILQYLKGGRSE